MQNNKRMLSYSEALDSLSIRIESHKKYSSLSLETWLKGFLPFTEGDVILDVGCGSGNLFPVYAEMLGIKGCVMGLDQSAELLTAAQKVDLNISSILMHWDLNNPLPFVENSFDHVISTFAIYYADDTEATLKEIHRVLKKGGKFFLVGPTDGNARELYDYNSKVFGFERNEKANLRTQRLEKEFLPGAAKIFNKTTSEKIPSKLVFPSREDFLKYYKATLLFEESALKAGRIQDEVFLPQPDSATPEISKEMLVVWGEK